MDARSVCQVTVHILYSTVRRWESVAYLKTCKIPEPPEHPHPPPPPSPTTSIPLPAIHTMPRPRVRSAAPSVVYSAEAHRAFVTGFRARKQARRAKGQAEVAERKRQERLADRSQRRDFLRATRLRNSLSFSSDDDEHDDPDGSQDHLEDGISVARYDADGGSVVTTLVQPLHMPVPPPLSTSKTESPNAQDAVEDDDDDNMQDTDEVQVEDRKRSDSKSGSADKTSRNPKVNTASVSTSTSSLAPQKALTKPKPKSTHRRRVSYTHAQSSLHKRKAQLRRRREARASKRPPPKNPRA